MRAMANRSNESRAERSTIETEEVAQFDRLSSEWWNERGPMRALHKLNPARIGFIRDELGARYGAGPSRAKPLAGLKLLDIGCGGGLLAEPLVRLGATVTAIDPGEETIAVARRHAERQGLSIDYRAATVEALAEDSARFDGVIASEVIEHVADPALFVEKAAMLVAPGGLFLASTINRTKRAYGVAILGAEVLLRILPRGTHDYEKFVTPAEFSAHCEAAGLTPLSTAGMIYNPLTDHWRIGRDTAVNYWIVAEKPAE
jgi:2-polyprenyl-6-hydroxyphenyl methylase / 3-demethylubiquinone-9 3-methyltransferase